MVAHARYQFILLYTVGEQALSVAREDVTAAARTGALEVGEAAGAAVAPILPRRYRRRP
jgi:NADPH2:quinone reductase